MGNSSHITISGSYFHDAFDYGGDGSGYGVEVCNYTSDCRIENNILHTLRHAMIAHEGANGNVFGYNYSFHTKAQQKYQKIISAIFLCMVITHT